MLSVTAIPLEGTKFSLGQLVVTSGVWDLVMAGRMNPATYLKRHGSGDWGDVCASDKALNDRALEGEDRLVSAYQVDQDLKIYVITEWDRSVTTVLLPSEY